MLKSKIIRLAIRATPFYLQRRNPLAVERLSKIEGKVFILEFSDLKDKFYLTVKNCKLKLIPKRKTFDVLIKGKTKTFLGMLLGRYDADELYFKRLFTIEGDIETATYLKNILAHF